MGIEYSGARQASYSGPVGCQSGANKSYKNTDLMHIYDGVIVKRFKQNNIAIASESFYIIG